VPDIFGGNGPFQEPTWPLSYRNISPSLLSAPYLDMAAPTDNVSSIAAANTRPRLAPRPAQAVGGRVTSCLDNVAGCHGPQLTPEGHLLTAHLPSRQMPARKRGVKAPKWSREQWEAKRANIRRLYMVEGRPLEQVSKMMATLYNFDASYVTLPILYEYIHSKRPWPNPVDALCPRDSMYKAKFAEWGEEFSKNSPRKRPEVNKGTCTELQPPPHAKRTRVAASLPARKKKEAGCTVMVVSTAATGSVPKPLSPRQYKIYEEMLHHMGDSIKSLFDKANIKGQWGWDEFGFTTPAEGADSSDTWKMLADLCHGASSLCQVQCTQKAVSLLAGVREALSRVVGQQSPWMFVYLWRIVLSVRGISYRLPPPKHAFFGSFLLFLRRLVKQHIGDTHRLALFLSALNRVPFTQTKDALEIVYRQAIEGLEQYLGSAHPTVLAMRGHFFQYWKGTTLSAGAYARYDALVRHADRVLGRLDGRTLSLRTEYMYATFYHGGDRDLTHQLAREVWDRTEFMVPADADSPPPTWSRVTYAYVLSSELLAHVDRERGVGAGWFQRLKDVVLRLQGGDDECRTRAAQVQEMLAHRCRLDGETERANYESQIAVEIRKTIPDAPAHSAGAVWEGEWKPDSSARAHGAHLGARAKLKAARKRSKKQAKATTLNMS